MRSVRVNLSENSRGVAFLIELRDGKRTDSDEVTINSHAENQAADQTTHP
jgi:hypothetical protein